jgi:hypothetical protein
MGSDKKKIKTELSTPLLLSHAGTGSYTPKPKSQRQNSSETEPLQFEDPSYQVSGMKVHRWRLGSQIGRLSNGQQETFRKLKYLHQSISSKGNALDSKTIKRNLHFSTLLTQWFPEQLIDQAITELHNTDCSKVVADESVVIRILGYIEALLRFNCRTIPWKTIFEINDQLGMNIDKNQIASAKFKAVASGAFKDFYSKRGNRETFDVIRFYMVRLIADLDVGSDTKTKKKEILGFSRRLCKFLESKRVVPKDPEIYGHAIIEIACKKVLKTRNLQTLDDPRLKKKLSTAIHYIKKQATKK